MTMYNNMPEGGELSDGVTFTADQLGDYDRGYTLLPEGDYPFTVVAIKTGRYQPKPDGTSKIGACKQITLTLRFINPEDGSAVDMDHNLYMWNSKACLGMIAQFYDSIGTHKKGEALTFDWREHMIIGKTGKAQISHRVNQNDKDKPVDQRRVYNNIKKLYPKEETAGPNNSWQRGSF